MTSQTPDPYQLLGVPARASAAEITAAYRRLLRLHHPDSASPSRSPDAAEDPAGSAEALRKVIAAYEVLHDPAHRAEYDRQQARSSSSTEQRRPAPRPDRVPSGDAMLLRAGPVSWQPPPVATPVTYRRARPSNDVFELMDELLSALDARRYRR